VLAERQVMPPLLHEVPYFKTVRAPSAVSPAQTTLTLPVRVIS
jgi:hypothetical protein